MRPKVPAGPEGFKEIAFRVQGNATDDVTQGGAEKNRQQCTGQKEDGVKKVFPYRRRNVQTKLYADGAQHKQPQDHHQWQVEAAKAGGIELGKGKVKGPAGCEQPDLIAIPDGADRFQYRAPLLIFFSSDEIDNSCAYVEAVEHDVGG